MDAFSYDCKQIPSLLEQQIIQLSNTENDLPSSCVDVSNHQSPVIITKKHNIMCWLKFPDIF